MAEGLWPERVQSGEVIYPPGGTFGPRVQADFQLVMVHSGWVEITVDDVTTRQEAGEVCLLTPGKREYFLFATDQPTKHSWIASRISAIPVTLREEIERLERRIPLSPQMSALVQDAISWMRSPQSGSIMHALAQYALSLFLAEARERRANPAGIHEAVKVVLAFVASHYREELRLEDLAREASMTPEHLCRLFQTHHGQSPMSHVWQIRTQRALELLRSTGLSVAEVAEQCGFKTPFHMYERVKAQVHCSPTEYRRQQWSLGRRS